jgi:hypothetical protein
MALYSVNCTHLSLELTQTHLTASLQSGAQVKVPVKGVDQVDVLMKALPAIR